MISKLERQFEGLWLYLYPNIDLETEVRLIPNRNFRFDFYHKKSRVAIELNGKIWGKGAHSSGKGLMRDYEKLNLAQMHKITVFQLSGEMINEDWLKLIADHIKSYSGS